MTRFRPPRLLATLCAGLLALTIVPTVVAAPSSSYQLDLGRRVDYVGQTNLVQCVGASMQMMLNMMTTRDDRSAATQLRLQKLARAWSGPSRNGRIRKGASVRGWARGLTMEGGGPYQVVGKDTVQEALLAAARAMRTTGRPVGLLVWRGRHAWVMSGFEATKGLGDGGRVTSVTIYDPLYPYGNDFWGPSPRPGVPISVRTLGRQFVPRRTNNNSNAFQTTLEQAYPTLSGKYVLVLPYVPHVPVRRPA